MAASSCGAGVYLPRMSFNVDGSGGESCSRRASAALSMFKASSKLDRSLRAAYFSEAERRSLSRYARWIGQAASSSLTMKRDATLNEAPCS